MNREHIKVGNIVLVKGIINQKFAKPVLCPITKVGRKYFYVALNTWDILKFSIKSLAQDNGQYIADYEVYADEDEYCEELDRVKISNELHEIFRYSGSALKFSLAKLKKIKSIIQEEEI